MKMSAFTGSTLLNSLQWSDTGDVQKFVEKYAKHALPCFVRVAEGFVGGDESQTTEFAQDEIFLVYEVQRQKRIVATDRQDKYVSIPFNYNTKFQVYEPDMPATQAKTLKEIYDTLEKSRNADFMVERNAPVSFSLGADMTDKRPLGLLRFDSKHSLKIVLAYPVIDRHVLPTPIAIPSYVPLTFQVASGLTYGTPQEFEDFRQAVSIGVKRFERRQIIREDIIITDELPEGDYEYIHVLPKNAPRLLPPSSVAGYADKLLHSSHGSNVANGRRHHYSYENHVSNNRSSSPPPPPPPPPRRNISLPAVASNKPFMIPAIPTSPWLHSTTTAPTHLSASRIPPPVLPRTYRSTVASIDSNPRPDYLEVTDPDDDEDNVGEDFSPNIGSSSSHASSTSPDCVFDEIGLVPANIASLSVEEISDCLHLLHLDRYIEPFSMADVDGQLLCFLDEEVLKEHFHLDVFEAKKLMRFAKDGWRPLRRCATPNSI